MLRSRELKLCPIKRKLTRAISTSDFGAVGSSRKSLRGAMLTEARQIRDGLVLFQYFRHGPALLVVLVFVLLLHAYAS